MASWDAYSHKPPKRFIIMNGTTICEERISPPPESSRKRRRVDDYYDELWVSDLPQGPTQRDPEFYKDDAKPGECIMQADKTLFKFNKNELVNNSVVLKGMLEAHGLTSDQKPLRVYSNAFDFGSFLWAIKEKIEFVADGAAKDWDPNRLASVLVTARQYRYPQLENAAWHYMDSVMFNTSFLKKQPYDFWIRLIDIGFELNMVDIRKKMVDNLMDQMRSDPDLDPLLVLPVAKRHRLTLLQSHVYYRILMDCLKHPTYTGRWAKDRIASRIKLPAEFEFRYRAIDIYQGYMSLSILWERLRKKAPEVINPHCNDKVHKRCVRTWQKRWIDATMSPRVRDTDPADLFSLLKHMSDFLTHDEELRHGMSINCKEAAEAEVAQIVGHVYLDMPAHFGLSE